MKLNLKFKTKHSLDECKEILKKKAKLYKDPANKALDGIKYKDYGDLFRLFMDLPNTPTNGFNQEIECKLVKDGDVTHAVIERKNALNIPFTFKAVIYYIVAMLVSVTMMYTYHSQYLAGEVTQLVLGLAIFYAVMPFIVVIGLPYLITNVFKATTYQEDRVIAFLEEELELRQIN